MSKSPLTKTEAYIGESFQEALPTDAKLRSPSLSLKNVSPGTSDGYRCTMGWRLGIVGTFMIVDFVAFGLNNDWDFFVGYILTLTTSLLGLLLLVETVVRLALGRRVEAAIYIGFRNTLTFIFIVGTVVAIINIVVHSVANSFLDMWPPSCDFGLSPTLAVSRREGQRACARIANYENAAFQGDGISENTMIRLNISLFPPVYRMSEADAMSELANFLKWYSPLNQSTVLSNHSTPGTGGLLVARVLSAVWGFPDYIHFNVTACSNETLTAKGPATLLQIQSQQAFGYSDVLVNARRVADFLQYMKQNFEMVGNNMTCY